MPGRETLDEMQKLFRQHKRGIRTSQEVVDYALGLLAYRAQFERVEPTARLLMEQFAGEIRQWVEFTEGEPQTSPNWMPYLDSRMVSEFYGGIAGGSYTVEQHQNFVQQMRFNVQQIAKAVRAIST